MGSDTTHTAWKMANDNDTQILSSDAGDKLFCPWCYCRVLDYGTDTTMITLRPYQQEAVSNILESLRAGKNPVCNIATGGGKSVIIAELCNRLDGRILVVTHRKELIAQNESTLLRLGTDSVGTYSAGLGRREVDARVVFAGVASVYKRMDELQASGPFRYVLWDEAHAFVTGKDGIGMADKVLQGCPDAQRIGFSATPYRLPDIPIWGDNGAWFDDLAVDVGILDLTEQGYLSRLVGVQAASVPNLAHVRTRGGDYAIGDLSQASSEEEVVNSACDEILYLAQDRKHILIFCVDRAHAAVVTDALRDRGCSPDVVLGNTPSEERAEILARFKSGEVRHLINVGVLTTGFDETSIDCVVLMRASQSRSLVIQMLGRACRLHPEKANSLILDMGGNLERHRPLDGLPKVLRSPRLAEEQKQEREKREREERERKARHARFAAIGVDPLSQVSKDEEGVVLAVTGCTFALRPAKKYPDRQNLLVCYKCETASGTTRTVTQFVLLQYPGRPGLEATAWFARRGMEMPAQPRRALGMAWKAPVPSAIVVSKNTGWDQVTMEHFEG